jgi:hypothetical protein
MLRTNLFMLRIETLLLRITWNQVPNQDMDFFRFIYHRFSEVALCLWNLWTYMHSQYSGTTTRSHVMLPRSRPNIPKSFSMLLHQLYHYWSQKIVIVKTLWRISPSLQFKSIQFYGNWQLSLGMSINLGSQLRITAFFINPELLLIFWLTDLHW